MSDSTNRDGWFTVFVMLVLLAVICVGAWTIAEDRRMDMQLEDAGKTRIGMSEEKFEEICADDKLIKRREKLEKHVHVELWMDDWLVCVGNKQKEEATRIKR